MRPSPHRLPAAASGTPRPSVMWRTMPRCTATSGSTVTPTISTTYGAPVPGAMRRCQGSDPKAGPESVHKPASLLFETFLCVIRSPTIGHHSSALDYHRLNALLSAI